MILHVMSNERKQELKNGLEGAIKNAERALSVLKRKEKDKIDPVNFEDRTSLNSKFEIILK